MTAVVEVIGLLSGVMGIWSFFQDMIPGGDGTAATFRVQVAVDGYSEDGSDPLTNGGGGIQTIRTYNVNHNLIGTGGETGSIGSGEYQDLAVGQQVANQATFAEFYANDDAVCIAYISATLHDQTHWAWTGDWGYICGLDWFYSGVIMPGTDSKPRCTWIDRDHSEEIKAGVIGINWAGFISHEQPGADYDGKDKCDNDGAFKAWAGDGQESVISKRALRSRNIEGRLKKRSKFVGDDRLVISSAANQTATELCTHPSSFGPDFVSLEEGKYCNMETRELLPLCGVGVSGKCFDVKAAKSELTKRAEPGQKSKIIEW
ncbi:hypothetical protein GE09DRAFT_1248602 [Coniochaeta sp. 2T2.1]|nr:hypothetical protein GE09DRAFT_1248602 [Coniochaeta sp. 2T2.1]